MRPAGSLRRGRGIRWNGMPAPRRPPGATTASRSRETSASHTHRAHRRCSGPTCHRRPHAHARRAPGDRKPTGASADASARRHRRDGQTGRPGTEAYRPVPGPERRDCFASTLGQRRSARRRGRRADRSTIILRRAAWPGAYARPVCPGMAVQAVGPAHSSGPHPHRPGGRCHGSSVQRRCRELRPGHHVQSRQVRA